jgi:hypothetical protein
MHCFIKLEKGTILSKFSSGDHVYVQIRKKCFAGIIVCEDAIDMYRVLLQKEFVEWTGTRLRSWTHPEPVHVSNLSERYSNGDKENL